MNELATKRAYSAFISGSATAVPWEHLSQHDREAWKRAAEAVQQTWRSCPHCGSELIACPYCDRGNKCLKCGAALTCAKCSQKTAPKKRGTQEMKSFKVDAKTEAAGQVRALTAAMQMMKERGYVVLGFHPIAWPMEPGERQASFCHYPLPGHELVLETPTVRADWTAQGKAIFGPNFKDPNKWERGAQFFRCKLVARSSPSERTEAPKK